MARPVVVGRHAGMYGGQPEFLARAAARQDAQLRDDPGEVFTS
ncbi:hypothetical protein ACFU6S_02755 [Streptomyces sp. NPDC057456]